MYCFVESVATSFGDVVFCVRRRYATVMSLLGLMRQAADHPAILTLMQYGGEFGFRVL